MAIHKLKQLQIDHPQKHGMLNDGGGLYLNVRKGGSKQWIFRYKMHGRAVDMGLGPYPTITLKSARAEADKWRRVKSEGIDPKRERDNQRKKIENNNQRNLRLFSDCAAEYILAHHDEWTNEKHKQQWSNTIKTYANPYIGEIPIDQIVAADILTVLKPIWKTKTVTATRVRQRIENILDWAAVHGYRSNDNPARWKGHLNKLLAKPSKLQSVKHHEAISYREMGSFLLQLRSRKTIGAQALEFTVLTGLRTSEVLGAKWSEIDLATNIWSVPAERMKMKKLHRVPLSRRAIELINGLPRLNDNEYLFIGSKPGKHISNMTMLNLLKRPVSRGGLGYKTKTVHGFRSTFRDWAAEQTSYSWALCEIALAHDVRSEVESAYQRGDLIEKRADLMQAWDDYLESTILQVSKEIEIGNL